MSTTPTKEELVRIIDDERQQWDALVATVPPAQMTNSIVSGDWTFRDVAAHLLAWREWGLTRLNAAANGEPEPDPPYPSELQSVDDMNAWFHERDLDRPAKELTTAFSQSFDRLKDVVTSLSDQELADSAHFPYMDGHALGPAIADRSFFDHFHEEHGAEIEAWLERIQQE